MEQGNLKLKLKLKQYDKGGYCEYSKIILGFFQFLG